MRGRFIVLEGIDGSGTTTQTRELSLRLSGLGYGTEGETLSVKRTAEPWDTMIERRIRTLINTSAPPWQLSLAFLTDRLFHVREFIEPALAEGCWVVSDRYTLSTLAYQGAMLSASDREWVRSICARFPVPDLTIVIDGDPDKARDRLERRASLQHSLGHTVQELDAFDRAIGLQRIVRERYLDEAANGQNIVVVDGDRHPDTVSADIWELCQPLLP